MGGSWSGGVKGGVKGGEGEWRGRGIMVHGVPAGGG